MTDAQTLTPERPAAAPGRPSAAEILVQAFVDRGFTHFTGVPCSLLKGVFYVP
ncbi:hypothetical protein [Streptomyces sp. sk226]|uniref:hypothetical protein n=1 Tax=Streptomyces sp. sk226 TaxID=2034268 RepID=UPI00211D2020|nr:hypothetical protein [Streptomyces sp. sk226]